MKNLFLFVLCILVITGCKRDNQKLSPAAPDDLQVIATAKSWYNSNYSEATGSLKVQSTGSFNVAQFKAGDPGKPNWSAAKVERFDHNVTLTYLPYDSSGTALHLTKYGFKRMLIYTYESGDKQAFWVEVNSDAPLKKGDFSLENFSGKVLVFDLNNTFLTGTRYSNGKKQSEIFLGTKGDVKNAIDAMHLQAVKRIKVSSVLTAKSNEVNGGGFICYDYYVRGCVPATGYCSDWVYDGTECTELPGSDGGSTGGGGGGTGTGGGGGGGGGGSTSPGTGDHEPGSGGTVGVNSIGYYFPANLYNGRDGNQLLGEYPTICAGAQALWNASGGVNKETVGVITTDNKFIYVAQVDYDGGSWGGLYTYQGQAYYTYPDTQPSPGQAYAGVIHSAGQYFIPIKGTIHTHSPCLTDGTNGITSIDLSEADQMLAAHYPNLKHYIIGCSAVGQFSASNGSGSPTLLGSGTLSSTCSLFN